MAGGRFTAAVVAVAFSMVAAASSPLPTAAPALQDLSITPYNISIDCIHSGVLPSLAGLNCLIYASVQYSGAYDAQALVSLQLDGYFANGTYAMFTQVETLGNFQGNFAYASSTTVNWTVSLPPTFETVQLLATVVVDWPNEVTELREDNNIARRMLQAAGLPYIVFVEHDLTVRQTTEEVEGCPNRRRSVVPSTLRARFPSVSMSPIISGSPSTSRYPQTLSCVCLLTM